MKTPRFFPNDEEVNLTIRIGRKEKQRFNYYAQRYGGMTPVLLRWIADFIDDQTVRQGEMIDEENSDD